jgi:hypothetical protein
MKSKQIVTILLLVFVVGTVAAMMYQELRPQPSVDERAEATIVDKAMPMQIIAYYFFGSQRCITCQNIEAYTQESLSSYFQDELDSRLIVWNPVNLEEAGNAHFVQDFQLDTKMVVLAKMHKGEMETWKKLEQIWPLAGNRVAFLEYVKAETEAYLKER